MPFTASPSGTGAGAGAGVGDGDPHEVLPSHHMPQPSPD